VGSVSHVVHSGAFGERNMIALFFKIGWDQYRFDKKRSGTRYAELVFLHPVGSAGHVVHSDASGRVMSMHYFSCSCGPGAISIKSAPGHVTPNLCFCMW
jgi:hypothetical protein